MEELQELLNEIKEGTSATQSAVSKFEKKLKELKLKEESVQLGSPKLETETQQVIEETSDSVVEEEKQVEENIPLESPELLPVNEPVIDELNLEDEELSSEEKPQEEISERSEEKESELPEEPRELNNDRLEIKGYKQGPENTSEIKGYFTSEKLKSTIDAYEETPSLPIEEPTDANVQEDQINNSNVEEQSIEPEIPSEDVQESVEEEQHDLVMPNEFTNTQISEELPEEEPEIKSNPEAVAENLANNFGDENRMNTVEELLREMEQKFEEEGKVR